MTTAIRCATPLPIHPDHLCAELDGHTGVCRDDDGHRWCPTPEPHDDDRRTP